MSARNVFSRVALLSFLSALLVGAVGTVSAQETKENKQLPCQPIAFEAAPLVIKSCMAELIPAYKNLQSGAASGAELTTGVTVKNSGSKKITFFQIHFTTVDPSGKTATGNGDSSNNPIDVGESNDTTRLVVATGKAVYPAGMKILYGDLYWTWTSKEWPAAQTAVSLKAEPWIVKFADGSEWDSPNKPAPY